jgi:hypothetical protein
MRTNKWRLKIHVKFWRLNVRECVALVELAEAQAALTIAEQKCAEFEACLLEQNENPPPPIPESQMSQPEDDAVLGNVADREKVAG